jgi:uncharacterized membrane protein YphA (DoxX/SURF4 family)
MFPAGSPGVALLMLRLSIVAQLHLDTTGRIELRRATALLLALELLCAALAAGLYTPVAAAIAVLLDAVLWVHSSPERWPQAALVLVNLTILFLIGPGAYSVDARRYGRRVTILTKPQ